ncbi:hypothetical protein DAERI_030274 [Deinococcus aerius]|uniref:Uncharacterized protein n=1 Tax=Deinococcus aerius TaxID=200253 RepID=A0A2I9DG68_9DEIO|nr:hypothetical protein [Deinococcus aerius]GBF05108.1 hypothetical protein DAERI_030274 [Deinococcus aerius]
MRRAPDLRLPLVMLGIAGLGAVAGGVRAALLEPGRSSLLGLIFTAWMPLLPVAVVAAFCLWLARTSPGAALGGGVAAALVAALYTFELLHPKYNQDANIGLGLYLMLGWLFPLGPAVLAGGLLGALVERLRGRPPTAPTDARPLPPLRPWLWPLLVPGVVSLAVSAQPFLHLWERGLVRPDGLAPLLLSLGTTSAGQLAVSLSPALLALLVLRDRAGRDGEVRPRLEAFWGLCLGLAAALGLFGFGQGLLRAVPLGAFLLLCVLLPVLGYGAGWLACRRPKS